MRGNGAVIAPETAMGAVTLRVADADRMASFYEDVIGLEVLERSPSVVRLGAGGRVLVEVVADPEAPPRPRATTGLFHLALLVPDRVQLAAALRRLRDGGWGLTGASDHLVSEALYTQDPEGNGIEIYRDRAREEWPVADGQLQMDTLPLDLEDILAQGDPGDAGPMASGTRMGHVHLNVADLGESERLYSDLLGFEPTVRGYPGALFVAAGGYHHHLGLNTWMGEGAPSPPAGSRGLVRFEVVVPAGEVDAIGARLDAAGVGFDSTNGGIEISDPSSNRIAITPTPAAG